MVLITSFGGRVLGGVGVCLGQQLLHGGVSVQACTEKVLSSFCVAPRLQTIQGRVNWKAWVAQEDDGEGTHRSSLVYTGIKGKSTLLQHSCPVSLRVRHKTSQHLFYSAMKALSLTI